MSEAKLAKTENGLVPDGDGWFVLNAREARWGYMRGLGSYTPFEGEARFPELGINVNVLPPGDVGSMYHAEGAQEDFLILAGEAVLVVEEEERPLRAWDFVHCPAGTAHVIVAAGSTPCVYLAIGARPGTGELRYPVSEVARRHGASVESETTSPKEAYARFERLVHGPYREGLLPGF